MAVIGEAGQKQTVKNQSGWEVPPNVFTGEGGYSTREPSAAFKPGAKPVYYSRSTRGVDENIAAQARAREQERLRQLELQRQRQIEAQRQAEQIRQQQIQQRTQTIQQYTVTKRTPTLSTGGQPVRNIEFGTKYAEYQKRLVEETRKKRRNLHLSEKEKIGGEVFKPKEVKITSITKDLSPEKEIRVPKFQEQKGGFSLTQKYFELSTLAIEKITGGRLSRVEFFKPGEYETAVAKGYTPTIKTKIAGGIINLGDIIFKGQLFAPYLSTGAVKKGTKTKQEQELVYKRRFDSPKPEDVVGKYEKIYATKGKAELQKELIKTFKDIKTEEGRKGFAELTRILVEKDLITPPSVRITTPPIVRTSFPEPPKFELLFDVTKISAPQLTTPQLSSALGTGSIFDKTQSSMNNLNEVVSSSKQKTSVVSISSLLQSSGQEQRTLRNLTQLPKQKQGTKQKLDTRQPQLQLQIPKLKTPQRTKQVLTFPLPKLPKIKVPPKTPKTPFGLYKFPKERIVKQPRGKYPVYVRRFGKWKSIGFGATPMKAVRKGKRYSKRTLGRSFYVPGLKPLKLPGFRTKKEKGKQIYIQKAKSIFGSTLGSRGEIKEIQFWKGLKKKVKPKKNKKGGKKK